MQIGLIDAVLAASGDTDYLLPQALEKVAFLPFGLLVDKRRREVFAGQVKPQATTRRGGNCGLSIRGSCRQWNGRRQILIRGQNTTCRETFLMHVTSWRAFYNFSFNEHCAGRRELLGRCIGARFMETRRPEKS